MPRPSAALIARGAQHFAVPPPATLDAYCAANDYARRLRLIPSTYFCPKVKGFNISAIVDLKSANIVANATTTAATTSATTTTTTTTSGAPTCTRITTSDGGGDSAANAENDATSAFFTSLAGYRNRDRVHGYVPETALRDVRRRRAGDEIISGRCRARARLQTLTSYGAAHDTIETMGARLQRELLRDDDDNEKSDGARVSQRKWIIAMLGSLYWRVKGDARNAVDCLQASLSNAPDDMKVSQPASQPVERASERASERLVCAR